eukprot:6206246-Pleurochrysis_carterae.AAC.2
MPLTGADKKLGNSHMNVYTACGKQGCLAHFRCSLKLSVSMSAYAKLWPTQLYTAGSGTGSDALSMARLSIRT